MKRWWWACALLVGCGGDEKGDSNQTPERAYTSDWDGVLAMIEDHCQECHNPAGQASGLPYPETLQVDLAHGYEVFVVPGDPDASRLVRALETGQMPAAGGPLEPYERDHVRDWIAAGAPNDFATTDLDGDGYSVADGDCDETSAMVRPGGNEVCGDGIDNDCNGEVDDGGAIDAVDWFPDADEDGFGDASSSATHACGPRVGEVTVQGDCDDGDPDVHPDQVEVTDGVDQDCDGYVDETTSYADLEPLFRMNCSCHVSGLSGVMVWGSDSRADMVDIPSTQVPTMDLIEPGDPSASYLWHKLNDTQSSVGGSGTYMPQASPALGIDDLARIEAWILDGAPP